MANAASRVVAPRGFTDRTCNAIADDVLVGGIQSDTRQLFRDRTAVCGASVAKVVIPAARSSRMAFKRQSMVAQCGS